MNEFSLYGTILKNLKLYNEAREVGFEYILNPDTGELHRVDATSFWGSHNLAIADLHDFIGLANVGLIPAHVFADGTELPVFDLLTGQQVGAYRLNKCRHCFPN